jgi:hypothetical protein
VNVFVDERRQSAGCDESHLTSDRALNVAGGQCLVALCLGLTRKVERRLF